MPSLLGISVVLFTVPALALGDPVRGAGDQSERAAEVRALLARAVRPADDPIWQRYFHWLVNMLQGRLGLLLPSAIDVDTLILQRLPVTIAVIGASLVWRWRSRCRWACWPPARPYSWFDRIASTLAFVGFSLPTFFTGVLLHPLVLDQARLAAFVFRADLRRPAGVVVGAVKRSIMPVMVLGLFQAASWMRYVRSSVLDVIRLDYVTTARSKACRARRDLKHVVRNALIRWSRSWRCRCRRCSAAPSSPSRSSASRASARC